MWKTTFAEASSSSQWSWRHYGQPIASIASLNNLIYLSSQWSALLYSGSRAMAQHYTWQNTVLSGSAAFRVSGTIAVCSFSCLWKYSGERQMVAIQQKELKASWYNIIYNGKWIVLFAFATVNYVLVWWSSYERCSWSNFRLLLT